MLSRTLTRTLNNVQRTPRSFSLRSITQTSQLNKPISVAQRNGHRHRPFIYNLYDPVRTYCARHSDMSPALTRTSRPGGDNPLPTDVHPTHYELAFRTDLEASPPSYMGEAAISLDIKADTSKVIFHAAGNLRISHMALASADLKSTSAQLIPTSALTFDAKFKRATLDITSLPGGILKAGSKGVKLWFRFESELDQSMNGYYRSEGDVDEKTGKKQVYALTQFESCDARKAFPCWDEPLIKSKYTITMIHREKETVLSNMPDVLSKPWKAASNITPESALSDSYELGSLLGATYNSAKLGELANAGAKTEGAKTEESMLSGEWKVTKFDTTPLMSTYLVAFACGEFACLTSEHKSAKTGKTVPLRIFATKNLIGQAQYGLDIKKWALPIYEEIYDIPYALPKLDTLVAHDFDAGAMENWGLITGRTTAYLYDEQKSSLAAKKRTATVQCHELAHMWFGDIVTMKWWDNLWLNEAFATLMGELVIMDRLYPEWKASSAFLNSHLTRALELDSQRSSHPIETDCPDEETVSQIFDSISYSKGASVLRMLMSVVGEDKFLKGVSIYLKKHVYGNAETKDLWDGISEASGLDVAKLMSNWTLQIGFPVIKVDETGDGKIKLTQNRFLSTGDVKPEEDEVLWWIPLEVKTFKDGKATVDHKAVLQARSATYDLDGSDSFKLNAETTGVYRVQYSPERLAKIGKEASSFSVEDRVGLVSDAATIARAGHAKTSGSLSLIKELGKSETEYLPWGQIDSAVGKLKGVWWEHSEEVNKAINKFRAELFGPVVKKMGFEHSADDSPDVKELRALAVSAAAAAEEHSVLAEIRERFDLFLTKNDSSRIPPDIQRSVYTTMVQHGSVEVYDKILEVYNKPSDPATKVDAMCGLCAPRDEALLDRTFKMFEDGQVKDQDYFIFFINLGGNRYARRKMVKYFMQHWDQLYKRFDNSGIHHLVKGSLQPFTSDQDLQEFKAFFKNKEISRARMAFNQSYDSIQASSDWLKRDSADVEEWLKANNYM